MKTLAPAPVQAEPSTIAGMSFLDAAARSRCLWPLGGAGAEMVCCGAARVKGSRYCQPHREQSSGGAGGRAV